MIDRKLTGAPPATHMPIGATDTQMHMYLPSFAYRADGVGAPQDPLPDPAMYRRAMDWLGIDRVVITQGNAHGLDNGNLLACLRAMGACARGVAVIDADSTEAEILALSELEPRLAALKSRWVLDHHAKIFEGATAAHVDVIKRLIDGGNVWFKFAGCYESSKTGGPAYEDIAQVAREIAAHAPERIIWGTNWPHNMARKTEDYLDDGLDLAMSWLPDDAARHRTLVETPQSLFGFPPVIE